MNELLGLIADINPAEIAAHIEQGDLAKWCEIWRQTATVAVIDYNSRSEVLTNADHIRGMTDEELAGVIDCTIGEGMACDSAPHTEYGSAICKECRLNWLKQPYKNEGM